MPYIYIYIDNVIENNVTIDCAIIANNVTIRSNCVIGRGCIIAHDVVIDSNCNIPPYTRIMSLQQWEKGYTGDIDEWGGSGSGTAGSGSDDCPKKPYDVHMVGENGVGYVWEYRGMRSWSVYIVCRLCIVYIVYILGVAC